LLRNLDLKAVVQRMVRPSIMSKSHFLLLLMTVLVTACSAPRESPSATPAASHTPLPATDLPTVLPLTPTREKVFVPKQNDLIFIEFFAVT
jgi:hypothetical protein